MFLLLFISSSLLKIVRLLSRSSTAVHFYTVTSCTLFWCKTWGFVVSVQTCRANSASSLAYGWSSCTSRCTLCFLPRASFFISPWKQRPWGFANRRELTGKCHFCKPDLEKHEIAVALSVCFVWTPPELAFMRSQSLWLRAQNLTGFNISWICEMCCP